MRKFFSVLSAALFIAGLLYLAWRTFKRTVAYQFDSDGEEPVGI